MTIYTIEFEINCIKQSLFYIKNIDNYIAYQNKDFERQQIEYFI